MNFEGNKTVIQIKDDQAEDCNHRITELLCCRYCELNAQICEKCSNKRQHENRGGQNHREFTIDQFNRNFYKLEERCSKETQNYARQINDIQKTAIESIRRKKEESLRQLEGFKTNLMKNTYSILQEKFTTLYQKWKNQRFDTLKCNEVFWVMTASVTPISIKHSLIDKELANIVKNFQNFKEVAKNIPGKTIFTNKQKSKQIKMNSKDFRLVVLNKDPAPVRLPQMDYSEEKTIKIRDKLNQQISKKVQERKILNEQLQNLRKQIQKNQRIKWYQRSRLTLISNVIYLQTRVQQIFLSLKKDSAQKQEKSLQVNQNKEQRLNIDINNKQEAMGSPEKNQRQEHQIQLVNEKQLVANNQNQRISQKCHQNQQKSIITNIIAKQTAENPINQPAFPMEEEQQQENSKHINKSNQMQQEKQSENANINKPEVKIQYEPEPYQAWDNSYLLQQIRKNGKDQQNCLKIENIQRLLTFSMKRLASPPRMNSTKCKKSGKFKQLLIKPTPTPFNQLASQLFEKECNKKNEAEKDKDADNK